MLTTKKLFGKYTVLILALTTVLTGCKPAGLRALLGGKQLLDRGQYAEAVEKFRVATSPTSPLNTNAQAWNYLGIAYQKTGQATNAVEAYKRALTLDQNLVETHYNLGCLWLEQNRTDLAKAELTAYTLRRGNSPEGWIKLGDAQLRSRDFVGAEKSFNQARQFDAQNPEALNGLGVVKLQRNSPREAEQFFSGVLKVKPDYAPAVLNLAIVSHTYLNNRQYALQKYQDYLGLTPRPANWDAVNATARALQQELNPTPAPPAIVASRPAAPTNTVAQNPTPTAPRTNNNTIARVTAPLKIEPATNLSKPPPPAAPVEVVQLEPEPVVRSAQDVTSVPQPEPTRTTVSTPSNSVDGTAKPEKRGFLSRVNPVNLFKGNTKTNQPTANVSRPATNVTPVVSLNLEPPPSQPATFSRYNYRSPKKPADGDRGAAEKAFAKGSQAQLTSRLSDAAQAYREATQADPGYFDPYYNLGVVSAQSGNLPQALAAYETALAIQPDSHDARFNFALVLKRANYPIDAVNELEKLLAKSPNDANAHYAVATLYAQQLRQPAKAREHYQKVLELNPGHPQASAIHDWLWSNPR